MKSVCLADLFNAPAGRDATLAVANVIATMRAMSFAAKWPAVDAETIRPWSSPMAVAPMAPGGQTTRAARWIQRPASGPLPASRYSRAFHHADATAPKDVSAVGATLCELSTAPLPANS